MKYTFSTDDENEAHRLLVANECHCAMNEIYSLIRHFRKHGTEDEGPQVKRLLDDISDQYKTFIT
jgi:hypothetical protein